VSSKLTLIVILVALCSSACNPRLLPGFRELERKENESLDRNAEAAIEKFAVFRELDHLCREEMPLFQGFVRVARHANDGERKFLTYFYSSHAEYRDVKRFYQEYFSRNEWRLGEEREGGWGSGVLEFRKDNYRIILYHEGLGDEADFAFHCEKLLDGNQ
jgi:hypothetical protein